MKQKKKIVKKHGSSRPFSRSGTPQPSPAAEAAEEDSRQEQAAVEGSNPSPAAARPTDARAGCERWQLDASASRPGSRQARGSHAAARHGSPCSHAAVARSRGGGELEREAMVWKWMTEKRSQESCLWCGDGRTGELDVDELVSRV